MSKRSEEAAMKAYPVETVPLNYQDLIDQFGGKTEIDVNTYPRQFFRQGYEQAEKDTLERVIEWWRPHLCVVLKEGLTEGVLGEFRKAMEE